MNKRDFLSSLFWLGFGILFCIGSYQHGLMEKMGVPGRGALPFLIGLVLIMLALIILSQSIYRLWIQKIETNPGPFFPQKDSIKRVVIGSLCLLGYGLLIKTIGFPVTTFIFMVTILRAVEPQKWSTSITFSALVAFISHILFKILHVELPRGIIGI
jgi:hypothetical protein